MSRKKPSEEFQSRWGDSELDDKGYLYVPGWIMRNYHKAVNTDGETVGLTPNEFSFLCHVMCFKYDVPTSQAKPSLETIAGQTGRHVSNIRKWKSTLEEKGLLKVTHIEGRPSIYDFAALVKQCRQFERENTTPSEITRGSEIDNPTPSEFTRTPLAESLGEDVEAKAEKQKQNEKSAAKPRAKSTAKNGELIFPVFKELVDVFKYSEADMGQKDRNKFFGIAKDLVNRENPVLPDEVKSLHSYVSQVAKRQDWDVTPTSLSPRVPDWRKQKPAPSSAQPPPNGAGPQTKEIPPEQLAIMMAAARRGANGLPNRSSENAAAVTEPDNADRTG